MNWTSINDVTGDDKNHIDLLYFKVLKPFLSPCLSFFPRVYSVMILPFSMLKGFSMSTCLLVYSLDNTV